MQAPVLQCTTLKGMTTPAQTSRDPLHPDSMEVLERHGACPHYSPHLSPPNWAFYANLHEFTYWSNK